MLNEIYKKISGENEEGSVGMDFSIDSERDKKPPESDLSFLEGTNLKPKAANTEVDDTQTKTKIEMAPEEEQLDAETLANDPEAMDDFNTRVIRTWNHIQDNVERILSRDVDGKMMPYVETEGESPENTFRTVERGMAKYKREHDILDHLSFERGLIPQSENDLRARGGDRYRDIAINTEVMVNATEGVMISNAASLSERSNPTISLDELASRAVMIHEDIKFLDEAGRIYDQLAKLQDTEIDRLTHPETRSQKTQPDVDEFIKDFRRGEKLKDRAAEIWNSGTDALGV